MATGSVTVTLIPPLVGATLVLRYRSYDYDEPIIWLVTRDGVLNFFSGAPFTAYDRYQVQFPAQIVGGVWYDEARTSTFGFSEAWKYDLPLAQRNGPLGKVTEINLPDKLVEGEAITGDAEITNIGDITVLFRCRLISEWSGKGYLSPETELIPGAILKATLPAGVVMPDLDAVTRVQAERYYGLYPFIDIDEWVIDDVRTH